MEFLKLTSAQLDVLPRDRTVFFFPVGTLENHGPHLPIGLNLEEADRLCYLAVQHLEAEMPGWQGVVMPKAPLGVDAWTQQLALTVRPHVLRDWLVDACQGLIRCGFVHFACFSGNLGPRQLTAIEDAGWLITQGQSLRWFLRGIRGGQKPTLISVSSSLVSGAQGLKAALGVLPPEHGGERDTSVALAIFRNQIDPVYQNLPAVQRPKMRWPSFLQRGGHADFSYWGNPAQAAEDSGGRYLLGTIDEVFPKMRAVWEGANPKFIFKSWYSILPWNKSFFKAWVLALLLCVLAFLWLMTLIPRVDL